MGPASHRELRTLARTAAASLRGRVLVVNAGGRVLVDSAGGVEVGKSYYSRPEIKGALGGHQVQVQRASKTLGQEILATAVPIIHDGRTAGGVRVTQSVSAVHRAVMRVEAAIALIGVIVLTLGLAAGGLLAGQIGRPLRRLEAVARRVAQGDLRARAKVEGSLEQRSLSSSFNEMTDRIDRLMSAQQDFVAAASHQLRTPLTGLRLRLEEAKALSAGPEAMAELDAAIGEVDRLSHTVNELLLLSRAGERPLAGASVDLGDLAIDALRRWRPEASERGITLSNRPEGAPGTVWASRADLERALDALLENALRYSPAGSAVTIVAARAASKFATTARAWRPRNAIWCSSASVAAPPAWVARRATGSGSRSRASWLASGAGTCGSKAASAAGRSRSSSSAARARTGRRMTNPSPSRALPGLNHRVITVPAR